MKFLLVTEPNEAILPKYDTSILLASELMRRGHHVDYLNVNEIDTSSKADTFLNAIPVKPVRSIRKTEMPMELGPHVTERVTNYSAILQRKDPPVDEKFIGICKLFEHAPSHIIQMNHPSATYSVSEHLIPNEFKEFAAPTKHCTSFYDLEEYVRSQPGETVAKPLHLYSGQGIEFFNPNSTREAIEIYWNTWKPQVVLQPYLKEVENTGDLRILMMNGRLVGSVLRKLRPGSRLANLHQGATPAPFSPTPRQLKAVDLIAKTLLPRRLYLLGIDFIGDYLTEINITCPSAVNQINEVMKIRGEEIIIDELLSLIPKKN